MSALKTKPTGKDVVEFIDGIEPEEKRKDCLEILDIMTKLTGEEPRLWGSASIGFGTYTYKQSGGKLCEWYLVGFSPRKQNISFHIMMGFDRVPELMETLGKYKTGKGCLYINKLADIHIPTLKKLLKEGTRFVKETYAQ